MLQYRISDMEKHIEMTVFEKLLGLLKAALNIRYMSSDEIEEELKCIISDMEPEDWNELVRIAVKNSVACLLYDLLEYISDIPENARDGIEAYSRRIACANYRMLILNKQLAELFERAGIRYCLMKGMAAAADFPVPDLRKAGDIDLLLIDVQDSERAVAVLAQLGFKPEKEQHSLHHISMVDSTGLEIEVHTMLAEPFDNSAINRYLEKLIPECGKHVRKKEVMGIGITMLEDAFHAYELLLHMLQHFLRAGFGVKLLCDWVVFWNRGVDEQNREQYLKLVKESGLKGFSDTITRTCIKYLGLKRDNVLWMEPYPTDKNREDVDKDTELFLRELEDAEEFGSAKNRMVALRGNGVFDYVREFHHQMHLNFPKAGKIFLFWPVLWIITLVRFLRNNRKIRSVSGRELLENAGKRGKLVANMRLFEKQR